MTKLKTVRMSTPIDVPEGENFDFDIDVNVTKEGLFTTTIPPDIAKKFEEGNINLRHNKMYRAGYFEDRTLSGLKKQIGDIIIEYCSKEVILEKVVIRYCIEMTCSYTLDVDGNIAPNCSPEWTKAKDSKYQWRGGNSAFDNHDKPYGFQIYAVPLIRKDYRYKSGRIVTEYIRYRSGSDETKNYTEVYKNGYYLKWLNDIVKLGKPSREEAIKELDYSEDVCRFFVNLIKSICEINEKIKDKLEPETILLLSTKNTNLLKE